MIKTIIWILMVPIWLYSNDVELTKEDKRLYLNLATSGAILSYGIINWGYNAETKFHASSEGWFDHDTKHGGADKMGHLFVAYLSTHLYASIYEHWDYEKEEALKYGVYSSLALTSIMEIGDGFGEGYGVSYEDVATNLLGTALGYYSYQYPSLDNKIDLRVEYPIHKDMLSDDFTTDYEKMKYLFALKGSGFETLNSSYLKYGELYLGYYTRGYKGEALDARRELFVGMGINLSELLGVKLFKYYQIPNSYIRK